ncbi:hypothetical protein AB0L61_16735 [Streptomyces tendae]|uniref:hypothetical protein n=1 Tax=Streptomyces tendae TaxID=1932 RepID=UPI00342E8C3B
MEEMALPDGLDDHELNQALHEAQIEREAAEREAFLQHVRELIWQETKRRLNIAPDQRPHSPNVLNPVSPAAKRLHLTHLEVASDVVGVMHPLTAEIAARAGRAGAGYPELGEAAGGISRQAARKRWPDAANTQWNLYTLTGPEHPHGAGVALYRSREKAISRGLYAVRQGQATTGGTFAAAVSDSTRAVVWACHFDPLTYDAVEVSLPESLQTVPAAGSQEHTDWLHSWARHVDGLT